jgi:hypothetical protein
MFKKTLLAAGLTAMATQAMAVEMPQGEVSLGLTELGGISGSSEGLTELGGILDSSEGVSVGLKIDVYKGFFAEASYTDLEGDNDFEEYGVGYTHEVSKDVRIVSELSYLEDDFDDAIIVKVGFEADLLEGVEFKLGAERSNWDKAGTEDTDMYFGMGVDLTKDITVSVDHRKMFDQTSVNVSWAF